jgi:Acyl-CoA reductase (LuxC)
MQRYQTSAGGMIQTIFSATGPLEWPDGLSRLAERPRRAPFDAQAIAFVATLSARILRSPLARQYPELAALAHWFRRANLHAMSKRVCAAGSGQRVRPRGLVFIIAPANVEVLFVYGWLLSLLAGNASIVRVSQKVSPVRQAFLSVVDEICTDRLFAPILADTWLLTYAHDDAITARISAACDARLVWGGDATVSRIRSIFLKPLAIEAGFADRFSFAIFAADRVCSDDDPTLSEIARRFANDTLWFAQQACSSPRAIVWIGGDRDIEQARRRFWAFYRSAAQAFENEPADVVSRVTDLFMLASSGTIRQLGDALSAFPGRALGRGTLAKVREIHSGHGLLIEYFARAVADIPPLLASKDQTLVAYGLREEQIEALVAQLPNRALDRIILPGQAMEFSTVWDGSELFDILTRKVSVPPSGRPVGER